MIAIIDYGLGNVRSVLNALEYLGHDAVITADKKMIESTSHLILPGVGAFGDAMNNLRDRDLVEIMGRQVFEKGKPFLGVCLGMQLLAATSEEYGCHRGLGWFGADVIKFSTEEIGLKVPHIGWNDITLTVEHPVFAGLNPEQLTFYFVHSYHVVCSKPQDVAATCVYGIPFHAAICRDNIVATQFHPEKSQDNGIQILKNFIGWRA